MAAPLPCERASWPTTTHIPILPGSSKPQEESRALQRENELWGQLRGAQITAELSRMEPSMVLSKLEAHADGQHSAKLPSPLLSPLSLGSPISKIEIILPLKFLAWSLAHSQSSSQQPPPFHTSLKH